MFFFSSRRRHTICALVTGVQTCALPIFGKRLKSAREKAGLSIQDVAERTRVPARHLVAIEEGRFQDLPALAYSSGFARSFAQAVGLDGAGIAAQFRGEASPAPPPFYDPSEPLAPPRLPSSHLPGMPAPVRRWARQ